MDDAQPRNTPELRTARLVLRRFQPQDAPALLELLSDPVVNRFLPWFPLKTLEEAQAFLHERFLSTYQSPVGYRYAVCLHADPAPVGYVNVSPDDSRDFGYCLKKELWNQGLITETGQALLERIRGDGVLPFLTATHDVNNPASGRVMEKLGMTYRYSYEELWQPKNFPVIFRMYQIDFGGRDSRAYQKYWEQSSVHFIEPKDSF